MKLAAFLALFALSTTVTVAPVATPALAVIAAPGDTFKIVAAWPAVADGQGPATAYTVSWQTTRYRYPVNDAGVTQPLRTVAGTADTLVVAMPPYSDSLLVRVTVAAQRNGYTSPSTVAQRFFRRPNPTPPAPTSVTLDTASTP